MFLGALAVGLDPLQLHEQAGVNLDYLRRIRPPNNIAISAVDPDDHDLLASFARQLIEHGQRLTAQADEPGSSSESTVAARIWRHTARRIAINIADEVLLPPSTVVATDYGDLNDDALERYLAAVQDEADARRAEPAQPDQLAVMAGPDAWLAALHLELDRAAAAPFTSLGDGDQADEKAVHEASAAVYRAIADAIGNLRRTGTLPDLGDQQ